MWVKLGQGQELKPQGPFVLTSKWISQNCPLQWIFTISFEQCLCLGGRDWNLFFFFLLKYYNSYSRIFFPQPGTYFSSDQEFHFTGTIIKELCKVLPLYSNLQERKKGRKEETKESWRKEERTKRILKFKLAEFSGALEFSWSERLPLTLVTAASKSHWLCPWMSNSLVQVFVHMTSNSKLYTTASRHSQILQELM